MQKKQKAFTLVELIVVITILAILGTIAFISLQGYSSQARDSTRISDISTMKTSLELFQLDSGKYPLPTDGIDVTYSGAVVWNQGSFGETVYSNVDKLDKIPTDPITNSKYTYSVTQKRNQFQIAGIIEGGVFSYNNIGVKSTNAGDLLATAYVGGNYNGQVAQSIDQSNNCNMLAVPAIIANDLDSSTDLEIISLSKGFVFNGYNNLPNTFKTSKFRADGGFNFEPQKLVVYKDDTSCSVLTSKSNYYGRIELLSGIGEAYSGTILESNPDIKKIIDLGIDLNNITQDVADLAGDFVNNNLGGKIIPGEPLPPLEEFTVSGTFGVDGSGASISVCGENVIADGSGNFSVTKTYGTNCSNVTATKSSYYCNTSVDGSSKLTNNVSNISGTCTQFPTCGSSNGKSQESAPATNLCSLGTASSVTTNPSNYTWDCSVALVGTVSCSAPKMQMATGAIYVAHSSTYGSYAYCSNCNGDKVIDGNLTTDWTSYFGSNTHTEWVSWRYASPIVPAKMNVTTRWRQDYTVWKARSPWIEASNDGVNWTIIHNPICISGCIAGLGVTGNYTVTYSDFLNNNSRTYFRLKDNITKLGGYHVQQTISIYEIETFK